MAGRELGRISGPLLADNLLRNGTNLAFDTQVLYLDVVNKRIGANNSAPATDLYTPTAIDTTNIIVDTASNIANFYLTTNNIQNATASITLGSPVITPGLSTNNLYLSGNTIANTVTNNDINITANGTGGINFSNTNGSVQVTVNGTLHATGSITFDGNVVLGDAPTDTITFAAEVGSNILPLTNNSYTLGTSGLVWNNVYTNTFSVTSTTVPTTSATTMTAGNFSFNGNTITNTSSNQNFSLVTSGTGVISVNGTTFDASNKFTNTSSGAYTLASTGTGYYKFNNSTGVSIGSGTTAQRPGNAVIGMTRFNTDLQYGESYNGSAWLPIGGQGSSLTLAQVSAILLTNVIIFGF
jgi:hypothetical protein